jgi:hypothetical protein
MYWICPTLLFVDGALTAHINRGEKIVLHLPASGHMLGIKSNAQCGWHVGLTEAHVTVRAGGTATYRIGYSDIGEQLIQPTASDSTLSVVTARSSDRASRLPAPAQEAGARVGGRDGAEARARARGR